MVYVLDVLNGRDDSVINREYPFYCTKSAGGVRWANINYDKTRIFKKERPKLIVEYKNRDFNTFD